MSARFYSFGRGRGFRNLYKSTGLPLWARSGQIERPLGIGFGGGFGRGRGFRNLYRATGLPLWARSEYLSKEDEIRILEDQARIMEEDLKEIKARIEELKKQ